MDNSDKWLLIKCTLERAFVVLEELLWTLKLDSAPQTTQDNVSQAKLGITSSLQDVNSLERASEIIDYQELVKKLEASDNSITQEVINRARQL